MPIDTTRPSVYPVLRYGDADAAISWLSEAFGFVPGDVTRDDEGRIVHATLSWANGVVMLSQSRGDGSAFDLGPVCLYLVVDDPDAHFAQAERTGAEVVMAPTDQPYGSREYAARDPEGNVWCFGTYQPAATTGG
ncbi:MAG TPA: VOC family protein [Acidimicrobiales bacterium]